MPKFIKSISSLTAVRVDHIECLETREGSVQENVFFVNAHTTANASIAIFKGDREGCIRFIDDFIKEQEDGDVKVKLMSLLSQMVSVNFGSSPSQNWSATEEKL